METSKITKPVLDFNSQIISDQGTRITIKSATANSWYKDDENVKRFQPSNAIDGNFDTFYSVKDGDADGNFLKLTLSGMFKIGNVKVTNRLDSDCCPQRIRGTEVKVKSGNREVRSCGTISDSGTATIEGIGIEGVLL
jgi:hypothetical protein